MCNLEGVGSARAGQIRFFRYLRWMARRRRSVGGRTNGVGFVASMSDLGISDFERGMPSLRAQCSGNSKLWLRGMQLGLISEPCFSDI